MRWCRRCQNRLKDDERGAFCTLCHNDIQGLSRELTRTIFQRVPLCVGCGRGMRRDDARLRCTTCMDQGVKVRSKRFRETMARQ